MDAEDRVRVAIPLGRGTASIMEAVHHWELSIPLSGNIPLVKIDLSSDK